MVAKHLLSSQWQSAMTGVCAYGKKVSEKRIKITYYCHPDNTPPQVVRSLEQDFLEE